MQLQCTSRLLNQENRACNNTLLVRRIGGVSNNTDDQALIKIKVRDASELV